MKELYNYAFLKLQGHSYNFFVNTFQGSLVAKTRRYVRAFEQLQDNLIYYFLYSFSQLLGIFVVLFFVAPAISSFYAIWCLVSFTVIVFMVHKKRKYDLRAAAADSRVTAGLSDAITGILNIKMFTSEKGEINRFSRITADEERLRRSSWLFNNFIVLVQSALWLVLEIGGLYMIVQLWMQGNISMGTILLVQKYFASMFTIVWNLRGAITNSIRAISEASEMVEIFEQEPDILDVANPEPCRIKEGRIVFDGVTFAYEGSRTVFKRFDMVVESGESLGLVGYSGSGKTTITKILLRFVQVLKGIVTIDGQDISQISQDDLRRNIAYVPQEPVLFHRSLGENISYGKEGASDIEIIEAAKQANAHDFITSLPEGYDTLVGERGIKLSGGERQRIAIARAMLKDTPILILDEATSSLDSITEQLVQEAFARLMENRTTIVIAHRLSTIRQMDRIVVLFEGGVIEEGTHSELIRKQGAYFDLWSHQVGGFIE